MHIELIVYFFVYTYELQNEFELHFGWTAFNKTPPSPYTLEILIYQYTRSYFPKNIYDMYTWYFSW